MARGPHHWVTDGWVKGFSQKGGWLFGLRIEKLIRSQQLAVAQRVNADVNCRGGGTAPQGWQTRLSEAERSGSGQRTSLKEPPLPLPAPPQKRWLPRENYNSQHAPGPPAPGLQVPECTARSGPPSRPLLRAGAERARRCEGAVAAMALNRNHSEGGGVIVNNSER